MRRALLASVVLFAMIAVGASGAPHKRRAVEVAYALDVVQTTSWTAHGSYAWCDSSTQRLPYDGSGQATLRLALPAGAHGAAFAGRPLAFAATLGGTIARSGSYVEHDAAVTSRPLDCPVLGTGDSAADTSGCGAKPASLDVALRRSGAFGSPRGQSTPSGCPWPTDIHDDASPDTPAGILDHAEVHDGVAPVALGRLSAPGAPSFAPVATAKDQTQTWQVAIPGGTLALTTTTQVHLRIALLPLIRPGHSIAGIRIGETLAQLRRASRHTGGLSLADSGDLVGSAHRWEWHVDAGVGYLDARGDRLYEDVWLSWPARHARGRGIVVKHGRPPASARVTHIGTVSSIEVTKQGLGEGSTLADLRRALPHGELVRFGPPIAWVLDGPGRRRTAFMLFRGVVQDVQIGCRQTDRKQRGAPVDDAALC
jgi:hypothetical protein